MKKILIYGTFLLASLLAYRFLFSNSSLVDMSLEMRGIFSKHESLPEDSRYDFALVVRPYEKLIEKEGVNFNLIRKEFGETFSDDGSLLVVFVKENRTVGYALVSRSIQNIDQLPDKLLPMPKNPIPNK